MTAEFIAGILALLLLWTWLGAHRAVRELDAFVDRLVHIKEYDRDYDKEKLLYDFNQVSFARFAWHVITFRDPYLLYSEELQRLAEEFEL